MFFQRVRFAYVACIIINSFAAIECSLKKPKILHLGFHQGCLKDFEEVAHDLGLDVTSWFIFSKSPQAFDGISKGFDIYHITKEKADAIWKLHKNYFDQFDIFLTSDTAPLARIFLQNQTEKPVIIWICNRFNYFHQDLNDPNFPDQAYYDLINQARLRDNVKIIPFTPYEQTYAALFGVDVGSFVIKTIGAHEKELRNGMQSKIPPTVNKKETFFLNPKIMSESQRQYIQKECENRGIKTYSGTFNGPHDLVDFKGIIYIPYQLSNLIFFEGLHRGLIFFVPSLDFRLELEKQGWTANGNRVPHLIDSRTHFAYTEWYMDIHKDLIVYFDSWNDLKHKIETTEYEQMRKKVIEFGTQHRSQMRSRWQQVFTELGVQF